MGFKPTAADPCVYIRRRHGHITIIAAYVDDILVYGSTNDADRAGVFAALSKHFDLKDLGELRHALGVEIDRLPDDNGYALHQSSYVRLLLTRYHMDDARSIGTPASTELLTARLPSEPTCPRPDLYRSLVGALLYCLHTRPDCAFAVSQLAKFMSNPSAAHWNAAKRVLRYLSGTLDYRLRYPGGAAGVVELDGFGDADWANDTDSRKSVSGTIVRVNGCPVHWRSFRQPIVAHSSTEAELIALDLVAREVLWHRLLLSNLGFPQRSATTIYQDNQSTIKFASNAVYSQRTKHIDVRYRCIRDWVHDGTVRLKYLSTLEMLADGLTKPLGASKFRDFVQALGLVPPPPANEL